MAPPSNHQTKEHDHEPANHHQADDVLPELPAIDDAAAAGALREKLTDAAPGFQAEFDPEEAERAGAFVEDALSEQDAAESGDDLVASQGDDEAPAFITEGGPSDDIPPSSIRPTSASCTTGSPASRWTRPSRARRRGGLTHADQPGRGASRHPAFVRDYPGALELAYRFRENTGELYGQRAAEVPADLKGGYVPKETIHNGRPTVAVLTCPCEHGDAADLVLTLRHEVLGHYGANTFAPGERPAGRPGAARRNPA
jgi:hypothetical protein